MKNLFKTKTFWLNVGLVAVALLGLLAGSPLLSHYSPYLTLAGAVVNIVLRTITSQPVYIPGTASDPHPKPEGV